MAHHDFLSLILPSNDLDLPFDRWVRFTILNRIAHAVQRARDDGDTVSAIVRIRMLDFELNFIARGWYYVDSGRLIMSSGAEVPV